MANRISHFAGANAANLFPQIIPMIEPCLRRGQGDSATLGGVLADICNGRFEILVVDDGEGNVKACLGYEITQHPNNRVLFVDFMGGANLDEWVADVENAIREIAKVNGCDCIEASCRIGLAKYLQEKRQWKKKAVIMEILPNE